jgi:hypothetical protein
VKQPSETERATHNLTHMPFWSWCSACVRGRSKESPSKARSKSVTPLVQLDYGFFRTGDEDDQIMTVLVGYCLDTSYSLVMPVVRKGRDAAVSRGITQWLGEAGLGGQAITLMSDSENSIKAVLEDVQANREDGRTILRFSVPGHSQAQGGVERFIQTLGGLVRTQRVSFEERSGMKLMATHPVMAWLARHCGWLHNRFHVRPDGQTPFQAVNQTPCSSELCEFGTLVQAVEKPPKGKLDARTVPGVWLGRSARDNSHIVATEPHIVQVRSIRLPGDVPIETYEQVRYKMGRVTSEEETDTADGGATNQASPETVP